MKRRRAAPAARNHTSWMRARALATGGGIGRHGRLRWFAEGLGGGVALPFPRNASGPALDAVVADAAARGASAIACWATGLEPYEPLAQLLVDRGFQWGWQPHWMAVELDAPALNAAPDPRVTITD